MKKNAIFLTVLFILFSYLSYAQLVVTNGQTGQQLGEILAGENITVSNASVSGNNAQHGAFTFSGDGLEVNSGVILSSGNIFDAVGPNNSSQTSTDFGGPGNALLSGLAGQSTHDATVLEFDFEVQSDEIEFNFIFLSEEYNEFVGSPFNDVFAFYISGPGIDGEENLAVVPGTTTPISINTINNNDFWQFYHDNSNGNTNIEFDGFTTLMTATKSGLQACETYTLKLMVADASDGIYDAGVLLQENSLVQASISASSSTYSDNNTALEGCIEADFVFQLEEPVDFDVEIPLEIGGTAINGVDYKYIDPIIVIPAGQTMATMIIESYSDGMTEGQETIEISYIPSPCQPPETVSLFIEDFEPIEFTATEIGANCNGAEDGEVLFTITGGFAPYLINLTDTITNETNQYSENPVLGLSAGTYSVEIIDSYGCKAEDIVFGDIFNAGTTFLPTGTGVTYQTSIEITGFNDGEIIETIDQLQVISLSMEHSYANDLEIFLSSPDGTKIKLKKKGPGSPGGNTQNCVDMGEPVSSGSCWDTWNANNITPGIGYEYIWNHDPVHGTMTYERVQGLLPSHTYVTTFGNELVDAVYFESGSYESFESLDAFVGSPLNGEWTIEITDFFKNDNGYIFEWSLSLSSPQSDSIITITEPELPEVTSNFTEPDCGMSNGEIDITVSNFTPTDYLWTNTETTEDITDLSSGTYSVNITGDDGCDYDYDFNLSSNGSLVLEATSEPETCPNADNGSIDLTITGGTEPFTFNWDSGQTNEDIADLIPGDYTITVSDNANCTGVETFSVTPATPIFVTSNITDENCGDEEGIIDITVSGGVEGYTFLWSNGETTEDIDELAQGEYSLTVTDANSCTYDETFTITNYVGNCIPDCDLDITNSNITDEMCGNSQGEIDLTIFTSFSPYIVEWTNGQTTDDINSLVAGDYSITITDAEGCELIQTYTIANQTSGLAIISTQTTNETCGNGQAEINITVNGGAMPYSFAWSNGATTEDLTNINAGNYSVIVTDANGCSVTENTTITNDAGTLAQTWGNSINETCGNAQGSIDILIEGGNPFHAGGGGGGGYDYYLYSWSNGATTEDLINLSAGNYSCIITDEDGCQITTPTYTIENEAGDLAITDIDLDNEICGNASGEIEILFTGGNEPFTFNWTNGEITQDIFNLTAGTYAGTVTDNNGCSVNTGNLTLINESGTLALNDINTTDELCNNNAGSIDITIAGGSIPYIYLWNTGSSSEDLSGINAGNYSCFITDQNGCEVNVNATINNDNEVIAVSNTIITDETCGNTNGAVDITITGASLPVSFSWDSGETSEDLTNISAGNYNCVITDNLGCQTDANATVENNAGTLSLDNANITNEQCGNADGSIDLIISGTETPFVFNWDNGETTEDISNLVAGDYFCEITDNVGCSVNAGPYTINNSSSSISVSNIASIDESCGSGNGSIDLTISGGAEPIIYAWSNGESTQDITGLSAGTYDYTITDNSGCSISGSVEIFNNAGALSIDSHFITNEICSNGNGAIDISVTGAEPTTYAWSNGETTQDITGLSADNYSVVITDNNGCEITSNIFNVQNAPGAFDLVDIDATDETCNNDLGSIEVEVENGTEPITYAWSNGSTEQDITNLSEGLYTCVATDANGCELSYSATIYNYNGTINVDNIAITDETCAEINGEIDITITGGTEPYTYSWSNGSTDQDPTALNSGDYSCIITDDIGCTTNASATVGDIGGDFAIVGFDITNEYCENSAGEIDVTVIGGSIPYNYSWNNGATTEDLTNISAGDYTITVIDDFGCETQSSGTILNIPGTLIIDDVTITDENCGNQSGAIDITYSGANEPTTFAWSNGEMTEDISSLTGGDYVVTITDNYGCSIISETYFVDNITNGFEIQNSNVTDENCGSSDGAIDITIIGGEEPYNFDWSNGSTTEDLDNLSAGVYSCIITDNVGCILNLSEEIINITNGTIVNLETITNDECASGIGSIDITPTGGEAPYTFLWNSGATTEDLDNLTAGIYFVTITDNTGCSTTSDNYTVENTEDEDLEIVNIYIEPDFCGEGFGLIDYEAAVPGTYTYELNGVPGTLPFENLTAGEYVISIVDGNCRVNETVIVESDGFFNVVTDNIQNEICGQENGLIEISAFGGGGGGGNFAYNWSNGETTQDVYDLPAADYSCEITHVNSGCAQLKFYTIENIVNFETSSEKTDATCENENGAIDVTVAPIGTYTYQWSNGADTEDITDIPAGTYTCEVSDTEGCSDIVTQEILNNSNELTITDDIQDDICEQSVGSIELSISDAPLGHTILWNTGETTDFIYNITSGTYTATITDIEFGCDESRTYLVGDIPSYEVSETIINSSCETCEDGEINVTIDPAGTYTYNWSNGETTEDITGLLPGDYTVEVYNALNCYFTETYTVDFETNIISKPDISFNVYPNPVKDVLFIEFDLLDRKDATITVHNILGEQIEYQDISQAKGKITLNTTNYAVGIYVIELKTQNYSKVVKFIKN